MKNMTKYIPPRIHTVVMEDIMEDEYLGVSRYALIEDPDEVLAKPMGFQVYEFDDEEEDYDIWTDWQI